MKKFYVFIVACLSSVTLLQAQTRFWVGPSGGSGGNWNDAANWAATSGGAGGQSVPNGASFDVIFDQNALVNVDVDVITLNTLSVTNSRTATLFVTASSSGLPDITVNSTSLVAPGLRIDAGSVLIDSTATNGILFTTTFASGAKGLINGKWYFAGGPGVANGTTFQVPATSGLGNRIDVNGTIQFRDGTLSPQAGNTGHEYIFFNSGSTFWLDRNGGNSPRATWNSNSTILVTGSTTTLPSINIGSSIDIGNLTLNVPGLVPAVAGWSLSNNLVIKGNLSVQNTNNKIVVLASNGGGIVNDFDYTVNGNFNISGTSRVALGNATNANKVATLQVDGALNFGGTSFDIQISNNVVNNPTTLRVRGHINHTAGTFGSSANITSTTTDLYVLELDGAGNQIITSTGTIDNASHEITLKMNNPAGATLAAPLTVGKISFNSLNKGRLTTTTANPLTIANTGTHALVVNSPDNNGFVNGPARRATATTGTYVVPTGKGTTYHAFEFIPSAVTPSVYQAEYFNTAFSDLSVVTPLNGVTNLEYWSASVISGVDARYQLSLNGTAVPGAGAGDAVVVARYNGSDWVDYSAGGAQITPGNSTTGSARTAFTSNSAFFTFGFGVAGSLPINLLTFDARKLSGDNAEVSWKISANSNPEKFEVLRSTDGRNFSSVGTVVAGSGQTDYSFVDNSLPKATTYYRLGMLDKDGRTTYSRIVAVFNSAKGTLLTSLIPTMVTSSAKLSISSSDKGSMQLIITDMQGRIVQRQTIAVSVGSQDNWLYLSTLPKGAYQVSGYMNNEKIGTIRFVKQ